MFGIIVVLWNVMSVLHHDTNTTNDPGCYTALHLK